MNQEEFLKQLREAFAIESKEHLHTIASGLLALEEASGQPDEALIETTYRAAHSLKGAARAVDLKDIEYICHAMESAFLALKHAELKPNKTLWDALHEALRLIEQELSAPSASAGEVRSIVEKLDRVVKKAQSIQMPIDSFTRASSPAASTPTASSQPPPPVAAPTRESINAEQRNQESRPAPQREIPKTIIPSTIRVQSERLDTLLRKSENLIGVKQLLAQVQTQLGTALSLLRETDETHRARNDAIHVLNALAHRLASESLPISTTIDSLIDEAQSMLMLPCSILFDSFPVATHDIAASLGKEVSLEISGQTIELEKRILEKLKDPLMHILRNAIDHGLETPDAREAQGKPRRGHVELQVSHRDARHIEIIVSDDGKGIDPEGIRRTAIARRLLSEADAHNKRDEELYALLFESGFSTREIVTDLSGRGLGLAIVKEAIDALEGSIRIESHPGKGSAFHLVIPYSKASFKGNFIRIGEQTFVIPSSALEQGLRIPQSAITPAGNANVIEYQDETISIVHLGDMLRIPRAMGTSTPEHILAIVCRSGEKACAFMIDELLGEQDVLIKPLGNLLQGMRGIYGATIGAHDEVIPILNMKDIIDMAFSSPSFAASRGAESTPPHRGVASAEGVSEAETAPHTTRILVVEDSITSRTLITSILSAAGYQVRAASDGIEGFTMLKSELFDLVVSDVEMPRLDGFGLTERIRKDQQLMNIPVVLVTALESKEHMEKGIEVGANAYITKRNFAQSNLLDTVRRFV